ncbi:hypothetical protein AB0F76_24615, partial [Streptomyces aureus]
MAGRGDDGTAGAGTPSDVLADAAEAIGTTLDETKTCEELADFACRHFCEGAAVDLLPPDEAAGRRSQDPAFARLATAGRTALLIPPEGPRPLSARALHEGRAIAVPIGLSARTPRQVMAVPLLAREIRYGVLLAVRQGAPFTGTDQWAAQHAAQVRAAAAANRPRSLPEVHPQSLPL